MMVAAVKVNCAERIPYTLDIKFLRLSKEANTLFSLLAETSLDALESTS